MTRLTDLLPAQAMRLAELECPSFDTQPWVSGPHLSRRQGCDRFLCRSRAPRRRAFPRP